MNAIPQSAQPSKVITLGGGCFWCTEAVFVRVKGVLDVESGYCNGHTLKPTYADVCTGETGHNEVVRLVFDPRVISLRELLEIFFVIHDPTTLNRQGHDVGSQYRSVIYFHDGEQEAEARAFISQLTQDKVFNQPIVTELSALPIYYKAEQYHQNYFADHPEQGYCVFVVSPKLEKFRKNFSELLIANA